MSQNVHPSPFEIPIIWTPISVLCVVSGLANLRQLKLLFVFAFLVRRHFVLSFAFSRAHKSRKLMKSLILTCEYFQENSNVFTQLIKLH